MRVKVKGGTRTRLKSGRPFSAARDCEVDLDRLGYAKEEQKELLALKGVTPVEEEKGSSKPSPKSTSKKKGN